MSAQATKTQTVSLRNEVQGVLVAKVEALRAAGVDGRAGRMRRTFTLEGSGGSPALSVAAAIATLARLPDSGDSVGSGSGARAGSDAWAGSGSGTMSSWSIDSLAILGSESMCARSSWSREPVSAGGAARLGAVSPGAASPGMAASSFSCAIESRVFPGNCGSGFMAPAWGSGAAARPPYLTSHF